MGTFEPLEFGVGKGRKDQFGDEGGTNCAYTVHAKIHRAVGSWRSISSC
jgi:hypothetical protein